MIVVTKYSKVWKWNYYFLIVFELLNEYMTIKSFLLSYIYLCISLETHVFWLSLFLIFVQKLISRAVAIRISWCAFKKKKLVQVWFKYGFNSSYCTRKLSFPFIAEEKPNTLLPFYAKTITFTSALISDLSQALDFNVTWEFCRNEVSLSNLQLCLLLLNIKVQDM